MYTLSKRCARKDYAAKNPQPKLSYKVNDVHTLILTR
jgi:hypothetical protein